ncbi:coiled-coil domain-containing protein 130 homolog [Uloborus diversus]|uniref:coiled-coil domain-containing protein 130 homolog n=1 Tax=Uloborus diversus TaxID=327109 RepID=UPI00240905C8|nr:coiled-coil domain-containing protein 130 homolog [Uloborus diversus]
MAERKAVNKYYPPEWTPAKGSINKFRGTHALRERARKLHMGILIIRFEMPFNIWCNGCENHIGMGVRYNAEKTKVGMYYTTSIYKFRMKCHLCSNHFEIQTDPQNLDYVILDGARRQERRWDPTQNDQVAPDEKEVSRQLCVDPMFRLEHGEKDKSKQKELIPSLGRLEDHQERWKDDYLLNKRLRAQFREKKKVSAASDKRDASLLKKYSLSISLLPESQEDQRLAGLLKLTSVGSLEEKKKAREEEILSTPIFPTPKEKIALATFVKETKMKELLKPMSKSKLGIVTKPSCTDEQKSTECSESDKKDQHTRTSLVGLDYDSSSSNDSG